MQIDFNLVVAILGAGIGGVGVKAATAWIKAKFAIKGFVVYLVSLIVSAAATALYLGGAAVVNASGWDWKIFAVYSVCVFVGANGWYNFTKKPK